MSTFMEWFFNEFLPPLMPWIVGIAIVIEIAFWVFVVLGAGWVGKKIRDRRRARRVS